MMKGVIAPPDLPFKSPLLRRRRYSSTTSGKVSSTTLIPLSKASVSFDLERKDLPWFNKAAISASFCDETRLAAAFAASAPKSTGFAGGGVLGTTDRGRGWAADSAFLLAWFCRRIGGAGVRPAFAENVVPGASRDCAMPEW